MSRKKKKIIYFYPVISTFIKKDIDILANTHSLDAQEFNAQKKFLIPFLFIKQLGLLLLKILNTDLIICRFAGYHSFLPALMGKLINRPVLIILGGNESHNFPSIKYGNYTKKIYGFFTCASLRLSKHLAPVDESLVHCEYLYDSSGAPRQGYLEFCPHVKASYTPIYNGYDGNKFSPQKHVNRVENSFLSVALKIDGAEYYRKGIDLIVQVASFFPDCKFTIVGASSSHERSHVHPNVNFIPLIKNEELPDVYSSHEFYMQLSMAEGFPNALCEAMLCGCIPIGSSVFAIPKIIGDTGFVLEKREAILLQELIIQALNSNRTELSEKSRDRILSNFHMDRRKSELLKLIDHLTINHQKD